MTESDRPVYCTLCGSIVSAGNNFCGVCGTRVSPTAPTAAPTREIPRQFPPPRNVSAGATNRTPALIFGLGVVVVLLLGVGTIVGLTFLRDESEPRRVASQEVASAGQGAAKENGNEEEAKASQPAEEERLGVGDSVKAEGVRATLNDVRVLPRVRPEERGGLLRHPDHAHPAAPARRG
jgi:hypothetical protein